MTPDISSARGWFHIERGFLLTGPPFGPFWPIFYCINNYFSTSGLKFDPRFKCGDFKGVGGFLWDVQFWQLIICLLSAILANDFLLHIRRICHIFTSGLFSKSCGLFPEAHVINIYFSLCFMLSFLRWIKINIIADCITVIDTFMCVSSWIKTRLGDRSFACSKDVRSCYVWWMRA